MTAVAQTDPDFACVGLPATEEPEAVEAIAASAAPRIRGHT